MKTVVGQRESNLSLGQELEFYSCWAVEEQHMVVEELKLGLSEGTEKSLPLKSSFGNLEDHHFVAE